MNGKQAKRLRKMAVQTAQVIATEVGSKNYLDADPMKIYSELKKIHNKHGKK